MTPARVTSRLATLERDLARYCAKRLDPATTLYHLARRATYRRRVIRDNLRRQRCLRTQGNEVGWPSVPLTAEDTQRAEALVAAMMALEPLP